MICGIDEAGKGSVLGPMVIGGVAGKDLSEFVKKGFADSKTLSPRRREQFYEEIVAEFKTTTVVLSAAMIDELRSSMTMNEIVARSHARAITDLMPDTAYVDACDVNEVRYAETISGFLKNDITIVSKHKADDLYAVVSAASIVAKVTRDRMIEDLKSQWGNIGSGYPSDPDTIAFLKRYIEEREEPPSIARMSWKTISNMMAKKNQKKLFEF
ncbi:ribonuclease HII [Methanolacinia paynteri]|uniref:ribonuclease HII n=1 Tax=Methanolacinia paynteri TaxID=230356 RepID=UPI00064FC590|nr:ribonuclease HII [Methanolacinia paynteri]